MNKPLDRGFNAAVLHIADRLFPTGFEVVANAPDDFAALKAHVAKTGRMAVWDGASDATIFGDAEVNYAFRAWHDWCHLKGNHDFTLKGEIEAARMQCLHLIELYGREKAAPWCALVMAEVRGQAEYFADPGAFPADQVHADLAWMADHAPAAWRHYAART